MISRKLAPSSTKGSSQWWPEASPRMRARKTAGMAERYFADNRRGLDRFRIAELVFATRSDADRAAADVRGGRDLYGIAEWALSTGAASSPAGFFRTLRRDELPPH